MTHDPAIEAAAQGFYEFIYRPRETDELYGLGWKFAPEICKEEFRAQARAAIAAYKAAMLEKGWKMCPLEPDKTMLTKTLFAGRWKDLERPQQIIDPVDAYKAMWSAAPESEG